MVEFKWCLFCRWQNEWTFVFMLKFVGCSVVVWWRVVVPIYNYIYIVISLGMCTAGNWIRKVIEVEAFM